MRRDRERWLKPGEVAAELGLSVKALRVYERHGLVTPARTASDWRSYGPAEIARLHLVIVLRDLGMSLKAIRALLDKGPPSLSELLTRQQEVLEARRREVTRAIALLVSARRHIASGQNLAPDDLIQLSRETVMSAFEKYKAVEGRIEEHLDRNLPPGVTAAVKQDVRDRLSAAGMTERDVVEELDILLTEMRRLMAEGDPQSEAAKAAVLRWASITRDVPRPSAEVIDGWKKGVNQAMADPSLAPELPYTPELLAFIKTVSQGMKARGELA